MARKAIFSNVGTTNGSVTVSGVSAGDILVYAISADASTGNGVLTWPTGFGTAVQGISTLDGQVLSVNTKQADGTEGVLAFGYSTTTSYAAFVAVYSGEDATTWLDVVGTIALSSAANSSPVSITANSITTTGTDDIVFISLADNVTSAGYTSTAAPGGFTTWLDLINGSSGFTNLFIADSLAVASGATGTKTAIATLSAGTSGWVTVMIGLKNAGGAAVQNVGYVAPSFHPGRSPGIGAMSGRFMPIPRAAGRTPVLYTQALTVASASSPVIVRQISRTLSVATASAATLVKLVSRTLTTSSASGSSIVRSIGKVITASSAITAGLTNIKSLYRTITASSAVTASLVAVKVYLRALTASTATVASMARSIGKTLTAASSVSVTVARRIATTITAAGASTATIAAPRALLRTITSSTASVATIVGTKVYLRALSATSATTAVIVRQVGKVLTAIGATTASLVRRVAKSLIAVATSSATATFARILHVVLSASSATSSSLVAIKNTATALFTNAKYYLMGLFRVRTLDASTKTRTNIGSERVRKLP